MTRIAHISDPHLSAALPLHALPRLSAKQFLGWLNWILHRRAKHDPQRLRAAVAEVIRRDVDCLLITGDLCQLGHDQEVAALRDCLRPLLEAGIPTYAVSGNHDVYGAEMLPPAWCRLRAELARGEETTPCRLAFEDGMILLADMGVPTPLFRAWGRMSEWTCARIEGWLAAASPAFPILLAGHIPLRLANGWALPSASGLRNAEQVMDWIARYRIDGYLCGHVHVPYRHDLGHGCMQYCAGSISGRGVIHLIVMEGGTVSVDVVEPVRATATDA